MAVDLKQITTAQEVFDYVANHLIKQGQQAIDEEGTCKYRGPNGTSCAVGCLIPDDEYNKRWETKQIYRLMEGRYTKGKTFLDRMRPHLALLVDLQEVHDTSMHQFMSEGPSKYLVRVADKHNLKVNF